MTTKLYLLALVLLLPLVAAASHLNGAYISYTVDPQDPLLYHFRFTLFDDDRSSVEDPVVQLTMGDGAVLSVARKSTTPYGNYLA